MIKRTSIYLIGIIITALGIALIIRSPFGTGPWDTVGVGMNQHFGWTIGTWTIITQGVLIFITAVIEKARPRMEAALVVVVRSWFLDIRSEEHTSELQSRGHLVCRLLREKK